MSVRIAYECPLCGTFYPPDKAFSVELNLTVDGAQEGTKDTFDLNDGAGMCYVCQVSQSFEEYPLVHRNIHPIILKKLPVLVTGDVLTINYNIEITNA